MNINTNALKKFAQSARRQLLEQVGVRLEQVLQSDSIEIREQEKAVQELREQISKSSREEVIDQVAYTWFNRFCALRYMDVNLYTPIGIVSPREGSTQPEILQEAKTGEIEDSFQVDRQQVIGLLNNKLPSSNPQAEAYRLLLVGACNAYHKQMPFLFPKIDDYSQLLMPDDLLSENSVLQGVRKALTGASCKDVEVIGWLYQYYISERKDEVFATKKAIEAEDIPAVTQLFTPHYIVRFLVENTLGRLWMLNHPESRLIEQMEYYIQPEEPESDFLEISSPEEIKVCDPACGSGHMLTYAFDLLYAIYEEQGYDPVRIPGQILQNNLFGIEIDQRAGHLAAFAMMMKARNKDSHFFSRSIEPNICVFENVTFTPNEIDAYKEAVGLDVFTQDLWFLLGQFEQADNFGALIRPQVRNPSLISNKLSNSDSFDDIFLRITNSKIIKVLNYSKILSPIYNVVITNPPYLRPSNRELKQFAKDFYPSSKTDLGVMFIERIMDQVKHNGLIGVVTLQSWMFLSSYKHFRENLLENITILSMAHMGTRAFDSIGGEVVSVSTTIFENQANKRIKGSFIRLVEGINEAQKSRQLKESIKNTNSGNFFSVSSVDFKEIPGSPIIYWVSNQFRENFRTNRNLESISEIRKGLVTLNDGRFMRKWHEVNFHNIEFSISDREHAKTSMKKWFPINKGGGFRKWFGLNETVVNWYQDGKELKDYIINKYGGGSYTKEIRSEDFYFKENITWSGVTSGLPSFRYTPKGFLFSSGGSSLFTKSNLYGVISFLNSKVSTTMLMNLAPSLNFVTGDLGRLPILTDQQLAEVPYSDTVQEIINNYMADWNDYELSWDFKCSPFLKVGTTSRMNEIEDTYLNFLCVNNEKISLVKDLEEQLNQLFISAYNLENELSKNVEYKNITLSCNPYYRYDNKKSDDDLEVLRLSDTMKEFISYAVGCMLGRYSLDRDGLILANAGETLNDYLRQVPEPTFIPDEDNVIPILDGEWFEDDMASRFKDFLKITFGEENYEENLTFLEEAIGRDIRSYFLKDYYTHHVKMYKKRPIYWLFSSPKGSFNALIYMHRYNTHAVSVILNDYLVQYREKLTAHQTMLESRSISAGASQGEKTKALKEIDKINKILLELKDYEDEVLYPLAANPIEIDLDDGVKINYNKFGKALKKVSGLSE